MSLFYSSSSPVRLRFSALEPLLGKKEDALRSQDNLSSKAETSLLGDQVDFRWQNVRTEGGTTEDAQRYLPTLLQVMEHAQKSQRFFPNLSHRHYGAAVEMNNDLLAMGTNVESSRQTALCDLRYATANAVNESVKRQPSGVSVVPIPLKVKTAFLVNANFKGDRPIPCSDCQEWMAGQFYTPDTKVVSLEQDAKTEQPVVRIRTVGDMLPFHQGRTIPVRMTTHKPISKLSITVSERAEQAMKKDDYKLTAKQMRFLLEKAQEIYLKNGDSGAESGLKTGVSVQTQDGVTAKTRFDWSTRWSEGADVRAVAEAFETHVDQQEKRQSLLNAHWMPAMAKRWLRPSGEKPKIQALAYYGDDPNQPALPSLGRIARRRGSSETLILTVENDVIQCRTIADFMPEMYQTR